MPQTNESILVAEQLGPLTRKIDDFSYAWGDIESEVFKTQNNSIGRVCLEYT